MVYRFLAAWGFAALLGLPFCEHHVHEAREKILKDHAPAVRKMVREDIKQHLRGIAIAAPKIAPGFAVEDHDARDKQMRTALKQLQLPPHGIEEFVISPMSFLAAVLPNGEVLCRDVAPAQDLMKSLNMGSHFPVVKKALEHGEVGYELEEFWATAPGEPASVAGIFAAPSQKDGQTVGAAVAGIPLWRWAQRISKQLRVDNAKDAGVVIWAYLYRKDRVFSFGTPPELDELLPDYVTRRLGYKKSPKGFTGEFMLGGRGYGYGVFPLPSIGEDVGAIVVRADPE